MWQFQAVCSTDKLGKSLHDSEAGRKAIFAKEECARCTVKAECLDFALSLGSDAHGIWGGTNSNERKQLRLVIA